MNNKHKFQTSRRILQVRRLSGDQIQHQSQRRHQLCQYIRRLCHGQRLSAEKWTLCKHVGIYSVIQCQHSQLLFNQIPSRSNTIS